MFQKDSMDSAIRAGDAPLAKSSPPTRSPPARDPRRLIVRLSTVGAVLVVVLSILVYFLYPYWNAARSVRTFEIERNLYSRMTMNPYGSFVIRSDEDLAQAIADLKVSIKPIVDHQQDEDSWLARCKEFEEKIRAARPNFEKESAIILLTSGYSSSTDVGLSMPKLDQGRLSYNIWDRSPSQIVRDSVHRGFVVIVQNDQVSEVEVWERGQQKEILRVAGRLRP
jgi:hypothetical protein